MTQSAQKLTGRFRSMDRLLLSLALVSMAGPLLGLSAVAAAQPSSSSGLALALEQAWKRNPQASALETREAEARASQAVAAGLTPDPGAISVSSRNDRLNRNLGKQEYEVELAAPLWLPGQRAARGAEALSRTDEVAARRAALRSEVAGELRDAWWALAAARNARALAARRLDTARALEADVRRRYTVGELSRIDANLTLGEVHLAGAELIEAQGALLQTEQVLFGLTGVSPPQVLDEESPLPETLVNQATAAPDEHPQLLAAAAAARSARARVTLADQSQRAAPEVALRVVRERADFNEAYANSVGIRLKIPFSSDAHVRRDGSAAQAEADQSDSELQRVRSRLRLDLEHARRTLQSSERQLVLARQRQELAVENLRLSDKAFSLGESDLATLLRIRAAVFDAEAFLNRQEVARSAAVSRLKQALGVLP